SELHIEKTRNRLFELIKKYYLELPILFNELFSRITYIPSIRELPQRYYIVKDYEVGENLYAGVFREIEKIAKKEFEITKDDEVDGLIHRDLDGKRYTSTTVQKVLNKLIKKLELGEEIKIEQKDEFLMPKLKILNSDKWVSLSEGSSGLHQLLPILVKLCGRDDKMVLIEQPELHLHPKLQAELANIFIDRELIGDKRLVIETHSEHLIRKLQVLIAKGELRQEDIGVYYFDSKGGESKVKCMEMDERGLFIEDWPDGFFDDSTDLTLELFQALKINKQKSN